MNFKFSFLLLSFLLSIEAFYAAPSTDARQNLKLFVLENVSKILKLEMGNHKKLAEAVITDPAVLEHKSELMDTYLNDFQKFIAQVNSIGEGSWVTSPNAVEIMDEGSRLSELFTEPETAEGKLVRASLIRHGLFEQGETLRTFLSTFEKEFTERAENYLNSLNENERHSENQVSDILNKLKNEPNDVKHFQLIIGYLRY